MPSEFTAPGTPSLDDVIGSDPDLEGIGQDDPTDLDAIAAELNAAVAPSTTIPVLGRPDYAVRFRTDFTGNDLDSLRKRSRNKRMTDGIDGIKFSALLLAFTCQGITRKGRGLEEDLGADRAITFVSTELKELLGNPGMSADDTVRKFYGLEGHVDATARRLMVEAGWGDEVDADPTA